jgi:peptidoglycan-N-acetylglucosamine deacetylase
MPLFNRRGLRADIAAAARQIRRHCGADPAPWFRLPFGEGMGDARLEARIGALGYRVVGWHVDGRDWASRRASAVADRVVEGVLEHGDGSVVLLHGWPVSTPGAVPRIHERLRAAGAEFVRLDQLEGVPMRRGAAAPAIAIR